MRRAGALLWLAGLAAVVTLVAWQGLAEVGTALEQVGLGIFAVCAFYPPAILADTVCWRLLLPKAHRPSLRALLVPRWICDAVNGLLPVAQIGGEVVRARLIARRGVPGDMAGAGVVVDVTAGVVTEIAFTLLGLALLIGHGGAGQAVPAAAAGVLVSTAAVTAFYVAQRRGLFFRVMRLLERMARAGDLSGLVSGARALDAAVVEAYGRRRDLLLACAWRMLGWLLGALEVWLALRFLGQPVGVGTALMLESLGQAIRHAAFMVPAGLGVQEGGFILLAGPAGLAPEIGLALSLVKRVREVLVGLPALFWWQALEGRRVAVAMRAEP